MTAFGFGAATDVGRVRSSNQDRYFVDDTLFAVADGMGGHHGGEIAAALAVDSLSNREPIKSLGELVAVVHRANDSIVATAKEDPTLRGMGTTMVALADLGEVEGEQRLAIANIGDSRIYVLAEDELVQLSEDHSLVEALVRDGRLTREEAASHPQRNVLTRALGIDPMVLVDGWEVRAVRGTRFLACSDGLFNEVSEVQIAALLRSNIDPERAARVLIEEAIQAGGRDNITVVVIDVLDGPAASDDDFVLSERLAVPALGDETATLERSGPAKRRGTLPERIRAWRFWMLVAGVIGSVTLLTVAIAAYARSSYYVGVDGAEVVIFQGRPGGTLWFEPTVEEPANLGVAELSVEDAAGVISGVEFGDFDGARDYARELALRTREPN